MRLFAARGYAATGIREIADEAGLTTAALYHHMGSKQDLLLAIMRDSMHEMIAAAREAIGGVEDAGAQLGGLAYSHVIFNGEHLLDAAVSDAEIRSLDPQNRARIVKLRDTYEDLWREVIERGVESGEFQIPNQKLFRLSVIQMCNGVTYWYTPAGPTALATIAEEVSTFALAMAAGCPDPGAPRALGKGVRKGK